MTKDKDEYIERVAGWLMPDQRDPVIAAEARESTSLGGVYVGSSPRIARLVLLAYLRGIRRGAGCAWDAKQPIMLREGEGAE